MARLGRAFPKRAVILRSQRGKVASGSALTSGGGASTASGRKNSSSSALTRGGGAVTESGIKHAFGSAVTSGGGAIINSGNKTPQPGSSVTSGGGSGSASGRKHASGRAVTSGGGSGTASGRKGGRGSCQTVGGGSIQTTGSKQGFGAAVTSGGGSSVGLGENSTPSAIEDGFSFGRPTPDLAGFRAAMRHKRKTSVLGEHITFLWAPVEVYASGTVLDPETGQPYDPTIEPVSSVRASATLPGSLAFRAINRAGIGGEAGGEPVGWLDKSHAMVILNSGYSSAVASATHFYARDSEYEIRTMKFDGVTEIDRYLVYGAREGVDPR